MGNVLSTNIMKTAMSSSLDVASSVIQRTGTAVNSANIVNIDGDCKITGSTISQSNAFYLDTTEMQKASIKTAVTNAMSAELVQKATTIAQNLSLNPGSEEAKNLADTSMAMATEIASNIFQGNSQVFQAMNKFGCKGCGHFINSIAIQSNDIRAALQLAQDAAIDTQAGNAMKLAISQTAYAIQQNAIGSILMAIALIIAAVLVPASFGISKTAGSLVKSPYFWIAVGIVSYLIVSYLYGWWPFPNPASFMSPKEMPCQTNADCPKADPTNPDKGKNQPVDLTCDNDHTCRIPQQPNNTWGGNHGCQNDYQWNYLNTNGDCPCNMFLDDSGWCTGYCGGAMFKGSLACPSGSTCNGSGQCCPTGTACGKICCPSGETCQSDGTCG